MINKTEALVLRVSPFSQTSHVVTWITPDHGRIATVVKGAMRPKSFFLGQYDLFYTCELLYYEKEINGTHIAKECTPLATRAALRKNWRSTACASYLSDLVARLSVHGGHHNEIYRLLTESLDFISGTSATCQFIFWFELRLLSLMGLAPRLSGCVICDAPTPKEAPFGFSTKRGGVICEKCKNAENAGYEKLSADTFAVLKACQKAGSYIAIRNTRYSRNQLLDLYRILDTFLSFHLETKTVSRKIAVEMTSPQHFMSLRKQDKH